MTVCKQTNMYCRSIFENHDVHHSLHTSHFLPWSKKYAGHRYYRTRIWEKLTECIVQIEDNFMDIEIQVYSSNVQVKSQRQQKKRL